MKKQQIKSQNTKNKIIQSASQLFAQKDYDAVSVADIVEKAECSVGAFYGHFKSKEQLVNRIWLDVTIGIIRESVEKGSRIQNAEELVDYLISRSTESAKDPLMTSLYRHCSLQQKEREELASYAARFLNMIVNALRSHAPQASEDAIWSYASIIHNLLNSHSLRSDSTPYLQFQDTVVRQAILSLMDVCRDKTL